MTTAIQPLAPSAPATRRTTRVTELQRKELANHTLVYAGSDLAHGLRAFYMKPPDGGFMGSTYFVFTPEGIVITGDLCPGLHGVISVRRYGIEWFTGRLSESYLCEKFLSREWVPAKGRQQLRHCILQCRRDGTLDKERARFAFDAVTCSDEDLSYQDAREIYDEAGLYDFEDIGSDYNPRASSWLCALQQRFAELYHQRFPATEPTEQTAAT